MNINRCFPEVSPTQSEQDTNVYYSHISVSLTPLAIEHLKVFHMPIAVGLKLLRHRQRQRMYCTL